MESDEFNPGMMAKKESHNQAKQEDDLRTSTVEQIMQMKDREGSHCRTCAHIVIGARFSTEHRINSATGGALPAAANTIGGTRT